MTDSRPQRAKALFEEILDGPPGDLDAFLKEACGGERELEDEVRSLVEAHREAEGFLEGGEVARALVDLSSQEDDPLIGAVIGDYRVLGLLGRGGMGSVYRAEQEHPHREVALKLIDRSFTTPANLRRFEIEAEVLARLQHPGIAQIYVAGTAGGEHGDRPYFAMELVDGSSLTSFADERNLDLEERLELVIRVCEAVQHAHQVGVIHRDLKPANILVTAEGQPKILDFGIARSTDADLQITTMAGSKAVLIGTLPYMSPEQVRGNPEELDTRSDVHALGILCYELLTGRLPRDLEGKSLTDAIRIIVDQEPRKLAAATKGRFPTDLETIVAKALESDRHRRYDSASGLAQDLRRFLDGQPISARPASAMYQLRKLVVRNRLPAVLVAGLVVLAVGAAVVMGLQARWTAQERDRATIEAGTANEVSRFLESLFLDADPEQTLGEALTARDLLDRGAERIETELLEQPAVRGRLLALLAKVYGGLGARDRALPLLEEAVEIGRALRIEHGETADPSNLELALCLLAGHYAKRDRLDEAIIMSREAVAVAEAVHGPESAAGATCINVLGYHLALAGEYDEARVEVERGLAMRERLLGPEHLETGWSVYQLAYQLRITGELEEARQLYERAWGIWQKTLPENHPQRAQCLIEYSLVLTELEEFEEALVLAEQAFEIQKKTLGPEHPAIADTLNDLGFLYWRQGDLPEAHRCLAEAVAAHRVAPGPAAPGMRERLYRLAFITRKMGLIDEQEAALLEALEVAREYDGESPIDVSDALGKLGMFYGLHRREEEAGPYLEEAAELLEGAGAAHDESLLSLRHALAHTLFVGGDVQGSLVVNEQILTMVRDRPELEKTSPLFTRWHMGQAMVRLGRFEDAEAHLRELLTDAEQEYGLNAFFPWNIRWVTGHCRYSLGFEEEALELYDEVLAVDSESLGRDLYWLKLRQAEDHAAHGRIDEALGLLREALALGLSPRSGELALLLDPRLSREAREALLQVIEVR